MQCKQKASQLRWLDASQQFICQKKKYALKGTMTTAWVLKSLNSVTKSKVAASRLAPPLLPLSFAIAVWVCHVTLQQRLDLLHTYLLLLPARETSNLNIPQKHLAGVNYLTFWHRQHPNYTAENLELYLIDLWKLLGIHTTVAKIQFYLSCAHLHASVWFPEDFLPQPVVLAGAYRLQLFNVYSTSVACLVILKTQSWLKPAHAACAITTNIIYLDLWSRTLRVLPFSSQGKKKHKTTYPCQLFPWPESIHSRIQWITMSKKLTAVGSSIASVTESSQLFQWSLIKIQLHTLSRAGPAVSISQKQFYESTSYVKESAFPYTVTASLIKEKEKEKKSE